MKGDSPLTEPTPTPKPEHLRAPVSLASAFIGLTALIPGNVPEPQGQVGKDPAPIRRTHTKDEPVNELEQSIRDQVTNLSSASFPAAAAITKNNQTTISSEHHGTTERTPFGLGWLGDSLAFGVAVAIDAMALMYTRSRRLLQGDVERKDENELRKKIGILHVVAPLAPFAAGYLASDALIATSSLLGTAAVTGLYAAAGAVMFAFANNVLREEAGIEAKVEGKKSLFEHVEGGVNKFGQWLINKMPSQTWALAMGVTVDAVISGLKFVQSSGWSATEVGMSCAIAGMVVYGLITGAQKFGAFQIENLAKQQSLNTEQQLEKVTNTLSQATAAGFFAFRYFAWTGFLSAGLTASNIAVNEWGLRAAALGLALGHGWSSVRKVWSQLKETKREDAEQFVGRREIADLESE